MSQIEGQTCPGCGRPLTYDELDRCWQQLTRDNAALRAELAKFHEAMERERKPDWGKSLKDLANSLEHDHPLMRDTVMSAAQQLRYMATSLILQLRWIKQLEADNAALRGQVESLEKQCTSHLALLEESRDLIHEIAAFGNCDCDIPNGVTCIPCQAALLCTRIEETQKSTTAGRDYFKVCPNCHYEIPH